MTEEQINTGISKVPDSPTQAPAVATSNTSAFMQKVLKNIPVPIKAVFNKICLKKKIFFPLIAVVCLLLIIVTLGLIFGNKKNKQTESTDIPSAQLTATPEATESANIITDTENELKDLGSQINSFDVYQYKLQPPTIDFEIEF